MRFSALLLFAMVIGACRSAAPVSDSDGSTRLIAAAVDTVNIERRANLSPSQRKEIVKQIVAENKEGWTAPGEERFRRYIFKNVLRSASISPSEMQEILIESKVKTVAPAVNAELQRATTDANVAITPPARAQFTDDLQEYAMQMATSGLPVTTMQQVINNYIRSIVGELMRLPVVSSGKIFDLSDYLSAQLHVFQRLVRVRVDSVPRFANVSLEGRPVGQTAIEVALAPARSYYLVLERSGFEKFTRKLFVLPVEVDQVFTAHLERSHEKPVTPTKTSQH